MALPDEYLLSRTSETAETDARVFYNGDTTGSKFFRIPFLMMTSNGTLIAGTDANFGSTGDSAENIDCAIRVKPNAAVSSAMIGWNNAFIPNCLHMKDYADTEGYRQQSSSVIDGVIFEDSVYTNRVNIVIDAFPWNGGVFSHLNINSLGQAAGGVNRSVALGDGFCTINSKKYLLLSSQNIMGSDSFGSNNINQNVVRSNFNYIADIYGEKDSNGHYKIYHLIGTPSEYSSTAIPVNDSNLQVGTLSSYTLNEDFELFSNGVPLTVYQRENDTVYSNQAVPMKIFYKDSVLQMYNTSYLLQVYSEDNGATWHTGSIISGMTKPENSRYFVTGPGNGIQLKHGLYAGRILVPIYCQMTNTAGVGNPATGVIYSDDGGLSWSAGNLLPSTLGLHESALVEMPDGSVKIIVRNTSSSGGRYIMATSVDGGVNWRNVESALGDNEQGTNCQISAINLSTEVADPVNSNATFSAIVMVTANNRSRTNGKIRVGLIKANGYYPDGNQKYLIDWAYEYDLTGANELFAYSSIADLGNGKIGILYETSPDNAWSTGLQGMYYKEISLNDIIGN